MPLLNVSLLACGSIVFDSFGQQAHSTDISLISSSEPAMHQDRCETLSSRHAHRHIWAYWTDGLLCKQQSRWAPSAGLVVWRGCCQNAARCNSLLPYTCTWLSVYYSKPNRDDRSWPAQQLNNYNKNLTLSSSWWARYVQDKSCLSRAACLVHPTTICKTLWALSGRTAAHARLNWACQAKLRCWQVCLAITHTLRLY